MTDAERLAEIRERYNIAVLGTVAEVHNCAADVPYLLALVERLTAEIERIQSASIELRESS